MIHLFEFMDQEWVPNSIRKTLREILERGNSAPFRPYYNWVATEVHHEARAGGFEQIVELGAGTAPVTKVLAKNPISKNVQYVVCDANPDVPAYEALQKRFPDRVKPIFEPVDFSQPRDWPPKTLLFLSATFHHIPPDARSGVLSSLIQSDCKVMVFEPLRKTFLSVLFVFASLFPALVIPLLYLNRNGRIRRFVWCWLLPVAPAMFWWDGVVSCVRQWTTDEWRENLGRFGGHGHASVTNTLFCQSVTFSTLGSRTSADGRQPEEIADSRHIPLVAPSNQV